MKQGFHCHQQQEKEDCFYFNQLVNSMHVPSMLGKKKSWKEIMMLDLEPCSG